MFKKRFLLAVTLVLILAGCGPTDSLNPLYTEKDLIFDPALLGTWVMGDGEGFYKFEKAGEKVYKLTISPDDATGKSEYEARLLRLDGIVFLDLYLKSYQVRGEKLEGGLGVSFVHTFYQVRVEGETLRYRFLDDKWVKDLAEQGKLKLAHRLTNEQDDIPLLTASTKDLQKFVLKYARDEDAFPVKDDNELRRETPLDAGKAHLKQGKYDEAITVLRQALEGTPNNSEVYASLAAAYSKKGSFQGALDAWRRASELEPENAHYRAQVGNSFFRLGDYSQARSEWQHAIGMEYSIACCHDYIPEAKYTIALSYFLEGQRSQALEQFEKYEGQRSQALEQFGKDFGILEGQRSQEFEVYFPYRTAPDAEAVVWYSLALRVAGRNDEADAVFDRYAKDSSIALVKYYQRKLTDADLFDAASNKATRCQAFFHVGYRYFESGRREVAREFFRKALETKGFTAYEYEAARVMLKRLEAE